MGLWALFRDGIMSSEAVRVASAYYIYTMSSGVYLRRELGLHLALSEVRAAFISRAASVGHIWVVQSRAKQRHPDEHDVFSPERARSVLRGCVCGAARSHDALPRRPLCLNGCFWLFISLLVRLVDFIASGCLPPTDDICCYVKALADPEPNSPAHCVSATL